MVQGQKLRNNVLAPMERWRIGYQTVTVCSFRYASGHSLHLHVTYSNEAVVDVVVPALMSNVNVYFLTLPT